VAWAERLPSRKWRGVYRAAGGRRSVGTFPHKAAALRAAGAEEERVRASLAPLDGPRVPWGDWCALWWPSRAVAPSTARTDAGRRDVHLTPRWGAVPLGGINRQDVRSWAAQLQRSVSPATVRRIVSLFSASLAAAVDAELLQVNPAVGLKLRPEAPAQERYLTRIEYSAIRDQLGTRHEQLVADLLVLTGLRFGEAAGLHWHRVDLERARAQVIETFDETSSTIRPCPKGRRARDVPLAPGLVDALRGLQQHTAGRAGACGAVHEQGRCRSGLVLTTDAGAPLRNSNWSLGWRRAVEAAGLGQVRIHDLRHTYASWLLQDGVPLAEVGQLLGHVSAATTQRYAWLAKEPSEAVIQALSRL
jgi:integrase